MGDGPRQQGLSGSRGAVKEYTLGLSNTERIEQLGVLDGELDDLLDLLDLLVQAADHVVSRVGDLLDHHECDERILLGREDRVKLVCKGCEVRRASACVVSDQALKL